MNNGTSTKAWKLVYQRSLFDKGFSVLQAIGMTCFALLFAGYLFFEIASLAGIKGFPPPLWKISPTDTWTNTITHLVSLVVGGWLAYSSISGLVKIIKDIFTRNGTYEGILKNVSERSYSGLRINYKMLVLDCADKTWEIYPRIKQKYLLRQRKTIKVLYSGGTKTIKKLWVLE